MQTLHTIVCMDSYPSILYASFSTKNIRQEKITKLPNESSMMQCRGINICDPGVPGPTPGLGFGEVGLVSRSCLISTFTTDEVTFLPSDWECKSSSLLARSLTAAWWLDKTIMAHFMRIK